MKAAPMMKAVASELNSADEPETAISLSLALARAGTKGTIELLGLFQIIVDMSAVTGRVGAGKTATRRPQITAWRQREAVEHASCRKGYNWVRHGVAHRRGVNRGAGLEVP